MRKKILVVAGAAVLGAAAAVAQQGPPQFPEMTFFVTSKGGPDGGNFGGLYGGLRQAKFHRNFVGGVNHNSYKNFVSGLVRVRLNAISLKFCVAQRHFKVEHS